MTAATNYSIKKYDNATSIVYTNVKGSGGDGDAALWRSDTVAGPVGQHPWFSLTSKWNGDKTARRIDVAFAYPSVYTETNTSLQKVIGVVPMSFSIVVPQGIVIADIQEASAQAVHLLSDPQTIAQIVAGFAAT